MNLDDYQRLASRTAVWREDQDERYRKMYLAMGLAGETGELIEKLKKVIRNDDGIISDDARELLTLEVGDVFWYLSQLAKELGISLQDAGEANIAKLADRAARGVLASEGDRR